MGAHTRAQSPAAQRPGRKAAVLSPQPHTITAQQLFPRSERETASWGCGNLISWICHSQRCRPSGPREQLPGIEEPWGTGRAGSRIPSSAACAPRERLPSTDLSSLRRVNPAALFSLTSVLPILGRSVLLGGQLRLCHQCPREGQEPRGASSPAQARGLHAGGVGGQRDGGCVVGEVLKLLLLKDKEQMVLDA